MAVVTLLSDFGDRDGYVGAMKGVVLSRAPDAQIVDLTHGIPAGDVPCGAWALRVAAPCFPASAIHVAVVDPGVGSDRRALLLRSNDQLFVGPDNGLLSWAVDGGARAWVLDRPELFAPRVSSTFHGRDVFASVAGHLAAGREPQDCGTPTESWQRIPWPEPRVAGDEIIGEVVHVDGFGNLITNITESALAPVVGWKIEIADRALARVELTFASVSRGAWVAYVGSAGLLEIGVRDGSAAAAGLCVGAQVRCLRR